MCAATLFLETKGGKFRGKMRRRKLIGTEVMEDGFAGFGLWGWTWFIWESVTAAVKRLLCMVKLPAFMAWIKYKLLSCL